MERGWGGGGSGGAAMHLALETQRLIQQQTFSAVENLVDWLRY